MRKTFTVMLAAGVMSVGLVQLADAGTASSSFQVNATVQATCKVQTNPLNFGTYTPGGGSLKVNTSVSVACTKNAVPIVSLDKGVNGTISQRLMKDPVSSNTLQYNLYQDAALGTLFGDGTTGTTETLGTSAGFQAPQVLTVYGSLPDNTTNQAATPGSGYTDTVNVTVTY